MSAPRAPTVWGCVACTLVNSTSLTACAACATPFQSSNSKRPREVGGHDDGCAILLCSSSSENEDEDSDGDSAASPRKPAATALHVQPAADGASGQPELADSRQRQRPEPHDPRQRAAAAAASRAEGNDEAVALALAAKFQLQDDDASAVLAQQLQGNGQGMWMEPVRLDVNAGGGGGGGGGRGPCRYGAGCTRADCHFGHGAPGAGHRPASPASKPDRKKPRCTESGQSAGGVLLVCEHPQCGPCLVVFYNRSRRRHWECPFGSFDGPPKHRTIVDTAAAELWEESGALLDVFPELLLSVAQRGARELKLNGMFAVRVDGLSRSQHRLNLEALRTLRKGHRSRGGRGERGLGACMEMSDMTFLPLENLEQADLNSEPTCVDDVGGVRCQLSSIFRGCLRRGGLALASKAHAAGDVKQRLGCGIDVTANPVHLVRGQPVTLTGVTTLVVRGQGRRLGGGGGPAPSRAAGAGL